MQGKETKKLIICGFASLCMILMGFVLLLHHQLPDNIVAYTLTVFLLAKIILNLYTTFSVYSLRFRILAIAETVLNLVVIVSVIKGSANPKTMATAIGSSCIIELFIRISKSVSKQARLSLKVFFGMDLVLYALFATILFQNLDQPLEVHIVLYGVIILFKGISDLMGNELLNRKREQPTAIEDFLHRIHGTEVILGLIILIVLSSFLLPYIEPGIETFGDSLWYCFALITTIGFGDYSAVTASGRILSVAIGCYGIVIVSMVTGIIVSMRMEDSGNDSKWRTANRRSG